MNLAAILADSAQTEGGAMNMIVMVIYIVIIVGFMYFIVIRPQKKQERQHAALVNSLEIGDSILTTSGFYGIVIDINDDMVIVEFGNNKNCRIPMQKAAIVEVEKPEA